MMAVSAAISEQAASLGVSILIGGALFLLYDISQSRATREFLDRCGGFFLLALLYCCSFCDAVSGK